MMPQYKKEIYNTQRMPMKMMINTTAMLSSSLAKMTIPKWG